MGHVLKGSLHHPERHSQWFGSGVQIGAGAVGELSCGDLADHRRVHSAVGEILPLGPLELVGRAEKFDEEVPVPSGSEHDSDVAVRAWQHVVEPVSRAGALDGKERIDVEIIRDDHGPWHEAAEGRLLRADLDALPVTSVAPLEDCGGRAERAVHRRTVVSEVARKARRRQMTKTRCVESARRGEGGEGLEMPMGSFTGESQVGERHVDQTGVRGGDRVAVERRSRTVILDIDVEVGQIELVCRDRLLASVAKAVGRGAVVVGMADPSDVGAEVGEQTGAERATQIGVVEDDDTGEWGRAGHVRSLACLGAAGDLATIPDMAAPSRVPTSPTAPKHYASPPRRGDSWRAERPGETIGAPHPTGGALGNQGPDQGYAIKLAKAFAGDLILAPGEHAADALDGAVAVGLRRASMFGRAPVRDDIELGLLAYGFLGEAPAALIELRRALFSEVHHTTIHYFSAREIADRVDGEWLRQPIASARVAIQADWKAALVDGES